MFKKKQIKEPDSGLEKFTYLADYAKDTIPSNEKIKFFKKKTKKRKKKTYLKRARKIM